MVERLRRGVLVVDVVAGARDEIVLGAFTGVGVELVDQRDRLVRGDGAIAAAVYEVVLALEDIDRTREFPCWVEASETDQLSECYGTLLSIFQLED